MVETWQTLHRDAYCGAEAERGLHGAAGYTALMRAAVEGHVEVMDLLVSAGARPMFESLTGRTALIEASRVGQLHAVVHLLGKLHVNPRQVNFLNRPAMPLHRYFYTSMTADSPEANAAQHTMGLSGIGGGPAPSPAAAADTNLLMHRAVWGFMAIASAAANGYVTDEMVRLAELGVGPIAFQRVENSRVRMHSHLSEPDRSP